MFKVERHAGGEVVRYRMARVLLGKPVYIASCYRIGNVMVDAGSPNKAQELRAALKGERVRSILVTHGHEDHAGNLALFRDAEARGAPGLRLARHVPFYRRVTWGEPMGEAPVSPIGDGLDAQGYAFEPLPTPGHTPDHLAYVERDRGWLFAGDAALGPLKYGFLEEDIPQYMASLRVLRDAGAEVVFPSHGRVLDEPREQLGRQLEHLERLRREARSLAKEGMAPETIARRLLGFDGILGRVSGGEFGKALLIRGLLREGP